MNAWIALWLACVSPDECIPLESTEPKAFKTHQQCLVYANDGAKEIWEMIKENPGASVRFTCVETKQS